MLSISPHSLAAVASCSMSANDRLFLPGVGRQRQKNNGEPSTRDVSLGVGPSTLAVVWSLPLFHSRPLGSFGSGKDSFHLNETRTLVLQCFSERFCQKDHFNPCHKEQAYNSPYVLFCGEVSLQQ